MAFNHKLILRIVFLLFFLESLAMIPSIVCSYLQGELDCARGMALTAGVGLLLGGFMTRRYRHVRVKMKLRESYFVVFICWATVIIVGVFPFLLCGEGYAVPDAIFESVASWTTSSAWVMDINQLPAGLALWIATSNWLGGMGVILIAVLVLSALGISGQRLANAEVPGPKLAKSKPRMLDTAKETYAIYMTISLLILVLLSLSGMPFFDALLNTMSSISTSGLMDYQGSVASHFTPYVKTVVSIASILGSLNFVVLLQLFRGRFRSFLKDVETRYFLGGILVATVFLAVVLLITGTYESPLDAGVNAMLETVSFSCTTGFVLHDITAWPNICRVILVIMMIIGGCSNSTAGGIKAIRFIVFLRLIQRGFYKRIHPRSMRPVMVGKTPVSAENASSISTFLLLYLAIYLLSCLVFSLENLDMETTLTAPIALFSNTGVGFGALTEGDYTIFTHGGRLYASLLMVTGRLEMYAILVLFSRSFWHADRAHSRG